MPDARVLAVDLDGTLVYGDTLLEGCVELIRRRGTGPMAIVRVLRGLAAGRAAFKEAVSVHAPLDASALAYSPPVLQWLAQARRDGHRLILATGASRSTADAVAAHLGIFDDVLATERGVNLTRQHKRAALDARFGAGQWDYLGNDTADLAVWHGATHRYVAHGSATVRRAAARAGLELISVSEREPASLRVWLRALRVHQWAKNGLIFAPALLAHGADLLRQLRLSATAFIAFSFVASSVYLVNDMLDLPHDRSHPTKRARALAAGRIDISSALLAVVALLTVAAAIALTLPVSFAVTLLGYACLTTAYSLILKRKPIVDVMVLAGLYCVRLFAGAAASGVELSNWLLGFSMFLFFSLALAKRATELTLLPVDQRAASGREYSRTDLEPITALGVASGCTAVLVMALYISSDAVKAHYARPQVLGLICPLMLYWLARVWLYARRGWVEEDPVAFALTDRTSLIVGAVGLLVVVAAAIR